jgi:hypothetical protein
MGIIHYSDPPKVRASSFSEGQHHSFSLASSVFYFATASISANMRFSIFLGGLPFAHAVRIIQSNDDGWAESNVRTLFNSLADAGHDVVLSGPAEQKSGTGS